MDIEFVRSRFVKHFDGKTGNIYASPGRINLIGEHTDYNGGFVFPGAVEQGIMAEIRPNGQKTCNVYSIDLKDMAHFSIDDPQGPTATWARYIYGIVQEMRALGVDVKPFNAAFAGDVPLGEACLPVQLWRAALLLLSTISSETTRFLNGISSWLARLQSTNI